MKQIMIAIVILLATLTNSFAGNSVWVKQQNQDKDTTIFIKQDGSGNKVGISANAPLVIDGENLTLIIRQIGKNNLSDLSSHLTFSGEDMTLDLNAKGDDNKLRIEGDTDSLQIKLRRELLEIEKHHNPIDIMFLYKILEWAGQLADHSEHIGTQLELILARS